MLTVSRDSYRLLAALLLVLFTLLFERITRWIVILLVVQLLALLLPGLRRVPRATHALLIVVAPFVLRADASALRSVAGVCWSGPL